MKLCFTNIHFQLKFEIYVAEVLNCFKSLKYRSCTSKLPGFPEALQKMQSILCKFLNADMKTLNNKQQSVIVDIQNSRLNFINALQYSN